MSDAFSPLDRFEFIAFDEATGVGLEPLLKASDLYARVSPLDGDRLSNMGGWLDYNCTPSDLIEGMRTYRFSRSGCRDDLGFKRARGRLGFYACQVRLTGAIYRVIRELRQAGCVLSAQVAASAHYAGRLRRHWRTRGPVSVLVPSDGAMRAWGLGRLDALLRIGKERELARAVLEHVLIGRQELTVGDELRIPVGRVTAATSGASGSAWVVERPAKVLAGPIECDDCTIYVIDRVLLPSPPAPEHSAPSLLPIRWAVHHARIRPAREESRKVAGPAQSPASTRPKASTLLPTLARLTRPMLRAGYHRLRTLRGAGWLTERMKWPVLRFTQRMASLEAEHRASLVRKDIAAVPGGSVVAPTSTTSIRATGPRALPRESIEALLDLQRARTTLTLVEVLTFYRSRVHDIAPDLPALTLVDSCIRKAGISERMIEDHLAKILDHAPDFAEAWYELGDIRLGHGAYAEAIACFDRCLTTTQAIPVPSSRASCDVLAASAKAVALERSGALEMAAEAYRGAARLGHPSGLARVAHGRVLRRLGRNLDAAAEFDAGMESDEAALLLPPMPHDFSLLAKRLIDVFGTETPPGDPSPER